jgi:hypothetical protein
MNLIGEVSSRTQRPHRGFILTGLANQEKHFLFSLKSAYGAISLRAET